MVKKFKQKILQFCFLIIILLIVLNSIISIVSAKNCGGNITCTCGDTLIKSYTLNSDLINCTNGLNIGKSSVTLNCNDHSFENIKGNAITIKGRNNIVIENCNFKNNNYGIYTTRRVYYVPGIFYAISMYAKNRNLVIKNNTFYKNNNAIRLVYDQSVTITNNTFKNNSHSIYSNNVISIKIFNNTFYRKNIFLSDTAHKSYCEKGYSNRYLGFKWSNCSCFYPYSNLFVNSRINICPGIYHNITNLYFERGIFNCNNSSKFIGKKNSVFALMRGISISTIENCDIENYSKGILFEMKESGYNKYYPHDVKIINDIFANNYIGIEHQYDRNTIVFNSVFRNNTYDFYRTSPSYSINYGKNILEDDFISAKTSGMNFCYNNYRNIFLKDRKIGCHCVTPYSGMNIDSSVVFCPGTYHITKTINIKNHNVKINCNNTILIGNKRENGFNIHGYRKIKITNCVIENFSTGVSYNSAYFPKRYAGYFLSNSYGDVLINNTFFNNNLDISVPQSNIGILRNNNLLSPKKMTNLNYDLNISNNYWGTNNFTLINKSFGSKKILDSIIKLNSTNVSIGKIYFCYSNDNINNNFSNSNLSLCVKLNKNNFYPIKNLTVTLLLISKNNSRKAIIKKIKNFIIKDKIITFLLNDLSFYKIKVVVYGDYPDSNLGDNYKIENISQLKIFSFNFNNLNIYEKATTSIIKSIYNLNNFSFNYQNVTFENDLLSDSKLVIHIDKNHLNIELKKNNSSYFRSIKKLFKINNPDFNTSKIFSFNTNFFRRMIKGDRFDIVTYKFKLFNRTYRFEEFKPDYLYEKNRVVVLAGGLWSDIDTWKVLARKIADGGVDTYLIELTGGKYETDDSYNYKYYDIITKILPKYLEEIKNVSNKNNFIYVGHSNGARVMVDFLNDSDEYNKTNINISKVFFVAPPGNFSNLTYFPHFIYKICYEMLARMNNFDQKHITFSQVISYTQMPKADDISDLYYLLHLFHHNSISRNIFARYCYMITSNRDRSPSFINKNVVAYFIGGNISNFSDLVVPKKDVIAIYNNSVAKKKSIKFFKVFHSFFEISSPVQDYILINLLKN